MQDNTTLLVADIPGAEIWGDLPERLRHYSGSTPSALVVATGIAAGPSTHFARAGQAERLLLVNPDIAELADDPGFEIPLQRASGEPMRMHPSLEEQLSEGRLPPETVDAIIEESFSMTDGLTAEQRAGSVEAMRRWINSLLPPDLDIRAEAPPR